MPVRIYDISKKLGLENKEVLAKAKELGIALARVASSSLDKITAEYLEEQLKASHPRLQHPPTPEPAPEPAAAAPPSAAAPALEPAAVSPAAPPVVQFQAGAPPEGPVAPPALEVAPPPSPVQPPPAAPAPPAPIAEVQLPEAPPVTSTVSPAPEAPPSEPVMARAPEPLAPAAPPLPPPPPPPPPGPKLGDKVGFIHLPPRPGARAGEKPGSAKPPARHAEPKKVELPRRGDLRSAGPPGAPPQRTSAGPRGAPAKGAEPAPRVVLPADSPVISIKPPIVVRELADQLKQKSFKIIADLMELGIFRNVNQAIDEDVAEKICAKYKCRFEVEKRERGSGLVHARVRKPELDIEDKPEDLVARAPVVTIMGHVDHGKTTLLDVIRKSNVAAGEAGGITQHIGAYTIAFPHPERKKELAQITFLDTPGHAAFSSMRARGANVTDIVVLVVAANDGVMPQTIEALNHARAAKVPILVAVNKMDHPNANSLKVRQQLQDKGLVPDDWGGDTIFVEVSALTHLNVEKLIEMILLQADLLELKANPNRRAKGNVIESGLEPGGPTATVLVRKGTLRVGDVIICSHYYGRVRALIARKASASRRPARRWPCGFWG